MVNTCQYPGFLFNQALVVDGIRPVYRWFSKHQPPWLVWRFRAVHSWFPSQPCSWRHRMVNPSLVSSYISFFISLTIPNKLHLVVWVAPPIFPSLSHEILPWWSSFWWWTSHDYTILGGWTILVDGARNQHCSAAGVLVPKLVLPSRPFSVITGRRGQFSESSFCPGPPFF